MTWMHIFNSERSIIHYPQHNISFIPKLIPQTSVICSKVQKMFNCNNCDNSFDTIYLYNEHQKIHKNDLKNKISCLHSNCNTQLKSYLSFSNHILRFHRTSQQYTCKYQNCNHKCNSLKQLREHEAQHLVGNNLIACNHCQSAKKIFLNKNAYAVHLSRCHRGAAHSASTVTAEGKNEDLAPKTNGSLSVSNWNTLKRFYDNACYLNQDVDYTVQHKIPRFDFVNEGEDGSERLSQHESTTVNNSLTLHPENDNLIIDSIDSQNLESSSVPLIESSHTTNDFLQNLDSTLINNEVVHSPVVFENQTVCINENNGSLSVSNWNTLKRSYDNACYLNQDVDCTVQYKIPRLDFVNEGEDGSERLNQHESAIVNNSLTLHPENNNLIIDSQNLESSSAPLIESSDTTNDFLQNLDSTLINNEVVHSPVVFENQTVCIIDKSGDHAENSLIVNALNWEIEQYISKKGKKSAVADPTTILAKTCLDLSAKHFATEPILNSMITNTYFAFNVCQEKFLKSILNSNLDDESAKSAEKIFNESFFPFTNSFNEKTGVLKNTNSRKKYNKTMFNYIEPIEIAILDDHGNETPDCFSYVSPIETVKAWLNNDNVRPFCLNPRNTAVQRGFFDVNDGNILKNNEFFNKTNTVQLAFFQDAFELCNPLGSSKSKFKMVGVYLMILNLPPFLRSKTDNIKLIMLCKNKHITKWGWEKVLAKFIIDIHTLETEGVVIKIDSKLVKFTGGIVCGTGDNLGNHSIGGYAENFGKVEFVCNYCEMKISEFRKNPFDRKPLRTIEKYNACAIEAMRIKKIVEGIKFDSPLNKWRHFHVARPGLAPCIAHDIYEGIAPYDLYLAISYLVKKKWIHLGLLNYRLNTIQLSNEIKKFIPNIPKYSKNKKLTGTASQIRRLLLILPLAMYDNVQDASDDVWQMILLLREISCIVSSPALSFEQILNLHDLITDYITLRLQCFKEPLRPKHDYMMHHPQLMFEFGPLKHVWTLRFESKHSYFKSVARSCKNFKNIHVTLAEKHELLQASLENQYDISVESKDAKVYNPKDYNNKLSSIINSFLMTYNKSNVFISKKVVYCGVTYSENMAICIGKNTFGNLMILKIQYILINEDFNYIYFLGWTDEVVPCDELGIYEIAQYEGVENRSHWFCISPYSHILSPDPLPQYSLQSCPVYLMKYAPFNPSS